MVGNVGRVTDALPGRPSPLGATPRDGGTNFAVSSSVAEGAQVCLFDPAGTETRFDLRDYDAGVWHRFVPGVGPGQAYGYRVRGPYNAARGLRCNPAKLLLDPYARATGPRGAGVGEGDRQLRPGGRDRAAAGRRQGHGRAALGHGPARSLVPAELGQGSSRQARLAAGNALACAYG